MGHGLTILLAALGSQAPLVLEPCRVPQVDAEVRCGIFWVYENRERAAGRRIPLTVIVLPARSRTPAPDPMWVVSPGGPGSTNSDLGVRFAWQAAWRDDRDVVLVDLRGTSEASRLDCALPGTPGHPEGYLSRLFPEDAIRACRQALERRVDLRFYNTPLAVDDLDEVRAALGYGQVNLWGASWGTRAVLIYLRRHPQAVRTAVLESVAPPSLLNPLSHARAAQEALDLLFAKCDQEPACQAVFPALRREFDSVLARVKRGPALVTIPDSTRGSVTVSFTWQQFAEGLRVMTYYTPGTERVPLLLHRAYLGDLAPFALAAIAANRTLRDKLRFGFLLSVTCTEDVSRIRPEDIPTATAGTYLGDSRVREQIAACTEWPHGSLPPGYDEPIRSDVPTFLLSGSLDAVSPPRFGSDAARYLSHSVHVIVPGGHVPVSACVDSMERAFLAAASPAAVDTTCVRTIVLPPFVAADPDSAAAAAAAVGAKEFVYSCSGCHSRGAASGIGPGLHDVKRRLSVDQLRAIIRDGYETMPSFGYRRSAREIDAMIAYLETL